VTPPPPITPELVKQYAELGVHRLVALAPAGFAGPRDVDSMLRFVDELAAHRAAWRRPRMDSRALRAESIARWDRVHDVVIVGHGGAGACAAIEAARAGADTLVLERMGRGGGTTALSTGVMYFGGGTRIQKACGFDDSVDEMTKHVRMAAGAQADEEKVRALCEQSLEHFAWISSHGVEFTESTSPRRPRTRSATSACSTAATRRCIRSPQHAAPAPRGTSPRASARRAAI
jgi:hypothetical protein